MDKINEVKQKSSFGRKKGKITSLSMKKTAVVEVFRFETHPKYGKKIRISKKYKVDDPKKEFRVGDMVEIEPCRPLSKGKRYKIVEK